MNHFTRACRRPRPLFTREEAEWLAQSKECSDLIQMLMARIRELNFADEHDIDALQRLVILAEKLQANVPPSLATS